MPEITGRVEITLSVRDPARSAGWYSQLLGMRQTYDHTSDDGRMRYICLVEPRSEFVLCLVGHAANPGEEFSEAPGVTARSGTHFGSPSKPA